LGASLSFCVTVPRFAHIFYIRQLFYQILTILTDLKCRSQNIHYIRRGTLIFSLSKIFTLNLLVKFTCKISTVLFDRSSIRVSETGFGTHFELSISQQYSNLQKALISKNLLIFSIISSKSIDA